MSLVLLKDDGVFLYITRRSRENTPSSCASGARHGTSKIHNVPIISNDIFYLLNHSTRQEVPDVASAPQG